MRVEVNGQPREVAEGATVAALLEGLKMPQPRVAVELNLELVPRARHAQTVLHDGDRVEVVTLVGGG
jgi:sulfur carrier protein